MSVAEDVAGWQDARLLPKRLGGLGLLPEELEVAPGWFVPVSELSIADRLALLPEGARAETLELWRAELGDGFVQRMVDGDWEFFGRPKQLLPRAGWTDCLLMMGRGAGKTLTGAKWVLQRVQRGDARHIGLLAPTAADARDVIVEVGPSSILQIARKWERPSYEPSKRRLTFPNGAVATTFSAEDEGREHLRGPQHDTFWGDECALWSDGAELRKDLLDPGMRLGHPQVLYTSTPRLDSDLLFLLVDEFVVQAKAILRDGVFVDRLGREHLSPLTLLRTGTTLENFLHLAPALQLKALEALGTRSGQQEYLAVLFRDVLGALWSRELVDRQMVRAGDVGALSQVAVGVDPSVGDGSKDLCGVVVVGLDGFGRFFVLEDCSVRGAPHVWAQHVVDAYDRWQADVVVVETNQGHLLVREALANVDSSVRVESRWASVGKQARAEPVAQLFELGRAWFVEGCCPSVPGSDRLRFAGLFDELCGWAPGGGSKGGKSPDRLDAMVWAFSWLMEQAVEGGWAVGMVGASHAATVEGDAAVDGEGNGEGLTDDGMVGRRLSWWW